MSEQWTKEERRLVSSLLRLGECGHRGKPPTYAAMRSVTEKLGVRIYSEHPIDDCLWAWVDEDDKPRFRAAAFAAGFTESGRFRGDVVAENPRKVAAPKPAAHPNGGESGQVRIYYGAQGMWWRPDGCGYTYLRAEAGVYSREDASSRISGDPARKERLIDVDDPWDPLQSSRNMTELLALREEVTALRAKLEHTTTTKPGRTEAEDDYLWLTPGAYVYSMEAKKHLTTAGEIVAGCRPVEGTVVRIGKVTVREGYNG